MIEKARIKTRRRIELDDEKPSASRARPPVKSGFLRASQTPIDWGGPTDTASSTPYMSTPYIKLTWGGCASTATDTTTVWY